MKTIYALPISFFIAILTGCSRQSDAPSPVDVPQATAAGLDSSSSDLVSSDGIVRRFEFLGCSGDVSSDHDAPDVWGFGHEPPVRFLVRHTAACGYTIGSNPAARIDGDSVELSYEMSNTSGEAAACECEYWATFELSRVPETIETISFYGVEAKLHGRLARR